MEKAKIWLDDLGIIHEEHPVAMLTLEIATYAIQERARLAGEEKKPVLVKFDRLFGYTDDLHQLDLAVMLKNVSALGFCVQGKEEIPVSQKVLIQRFYEETPYPVPVKVFFNETAAIEWLKTHV